MNQGSSKSLLPLIEIIISIGIFAIAAVLTLQLFLLAKFLGDKTSDIAEAMLAVQNTAEKIKLCSTADKMNEFFKTETSAAVSDNNESDFVIYYDENFNKLSAEAKNSEIIFYMNIKRNIITNSAGELYNYTLNIYKSSPYPFIDDKKLENDTDYIPRLAQVTMSKFIY